MHDHDLDARRVARIIGAQFPAVVAASVHYLGEGYDSTAFDVDGRWVFRFPKRADVEAQVLVEMRVLSVLARESPLPLPAFCFHGRPSADFPRHFAGYPKLIGVPALSIEPDRSALERWAPAIAGFLSWLHARPVEDLMPLGIPCAQGSLIAEARTDALDDLVNVARTAPDAPVAKWRDYLSSPPSSEPRDDRHVVVHRDLAAEHVLCDPESLHLTGVIDWTEIAIDDPAVDLAALFHWGGPWFADATLASYRGDIDETTLIRARYLAACRGASDVTCGLEMKRPEYVHAGLRALRWCID